MRLLSPAVDYRDFRLNRINEPQYRHVWYLLFWPIYGLRYLLIENCHPADHYYPVHCAMDDLIPFHEVFVIPYMIWYVFIIGMHLYTFFYDVDSFMKYSKNLILSISISTVIYLVFPNCQNLRPAEYPRDNILTSITRLVHAVDTNTNVCPSEHVIGSVAAFAAAVNTKTLCIPKRITVIAVTLFFTAIATVFLKQHSVVDVLAALPICILAYWICYRKQNTN